jgi:uncharacterized short protein YbdD (DUF466 family)
MSKSPGARPWYRLGHRLGRRLGHAARETWQVLRGVLGERAYENYVAHHAATHPNETPMSEREFWRRQGDREPPARCC